MARSRKSCMTFGAKVDTRRAVAAEGLTIYSISSHFAARAASASYARSHKEIIEKNKIMWLKRTEVHEFRWKLATCKCQELQAPGKQPRRRMHVSCKYVRKRKKKSVVSSYGDWKKRQILHASSAACGRRFLFARGPDVDFFAGFENTASCRCSTTCWLSPTLSACLRCRPLTGSYVLRCFVHG